MEQKTAEERALDIMFDGWARLKALGWREATYAPKDNSIFLSIEAGSTGVHHTSRDKTGSFWIHAQGDIWPSHPILWKEKPSCAS